MAADIKEAARLIDHAQAFAALVCEALYPSHGRTSPFDIFECIANGLTLAVTGGLVIQPHTIKLQIFSLYGSIYNSTSPCGL